MDVKQLFEGATGVLLVIALLCLGAVFGLSGAILMRGVTGETLPQLWGSVLGSGIGATATLWVALYSQRLVEKRELRRPVNELRSQFDDLHLLTYTLVDAIEQAGEIDPEEASRYSDKVISNEYRERWNDIRNAYDEVEKALEKIQPGLALPPTLMTKVNQFKEKIEGRADAGCEQASLALNQHWVTPSKMKSELGEARKEAWGAHSGCVEAINFLRKQI
jgi:hypothetical protein